jgi:glycosyltransferase involved in cell wall biosynthesis
MLKISLIVATLGERIEDLSALMNSLLPQVEFIREIIVVDQHPDPLHLPAQLSTFLNTLPLRIIRSERGLSRARNNGLAMAIGDLVAFPDDDCIYPAGLLEWVVNWFETNVEYDILAVGAKDSSGELSGNRWPQNCCDLAPLNVFRTTFSSSLFLCTDLAKSARFDTRLGVGANTPYGSGEETDYVLRLLRARVRGRFNRTRHIIHPRRDMLSGTVSLERARAYGFGMGHVLRINSLFVLWTSFLVYNLARAGLVLLRGKMVNAALCLAQTRGLWNGFLVAISSHVNDRRQLQIVSAHKRRSAVILQLKPTAPSEAPLPTFNTTGTQIDHLPESSIRSSRSGWPLPVTTRISHCRMCISILQDIRA